MAVGTGLQWVTGATRPAFGSTEIVEHLREVRETVHVVRELPEGRIGLVAGGQLAAATVDAAYAHLGTLPPLYPEWLGDRAFCEAHGVRFAYVGGAMANGIASPQMVIALARAGMLGFLGTAGLSLEAMTERLAVLEAELAPSGAPYGANLIHSPQQPQLEMQTVELFLARGVRRIEAAAFMALSPAIVRFAASGLYRDAAGRIGRNTFVFAKISRAEVAERFMAPAPPEMLDALVAQGHITAEQAELARRVPVAEDITVESDSGGHTDNRPLGALFPSIAALRDTLASRHGYRRPIRLGAAGGLGTPQAVAAAFAMGAAYVVTGSINQASVEAAQSPAVKQLLARAGIADVVMAPAGDMFEMGVKVQVLKRGSMFGVRAKRLYDLYTNYPGIEAIPVDVRERVEREIFQKSFEEVWAETRAFFERRDPAEVDRALQDPKHRLALVCRWYLGLSSRWAIDGVPGRTLDYQVWMGPAQGAFNDWVRGSFLEPAEGRHVAQMALNLLEGAAVVTRAGQLRAFGAAVPPEAFQYRPQPLSVA